MAITGFDAWGNRIDAPASARRVTSSVDPLVAALEADNRALRKRVAELELALKGSATVTLGASATVPTSVSSATSEKTKSATDNSKAKLKDEPWVDLGLSRRTYFRRKAAGTL